MNPLCNFCGAQRALVYCRSDESRLCLPCDADIHSTNDMSSRHLRAQLCDRCHAQPAISLCLNDRLALCDLCGLAAAPRRFIPVSFYSGCPTADEFSAIFYASPNPFNSSATWDLPSVSNVGFSGLANPMESETTWIPSPSTCIAPEFTSFYPSGEDQAPFFTQDFNVQNTSSSIPQDCVAVLPSYTVQSTNNNADQLLLNMNASKSKLDSNQEIGCPRARNEAKKCYYDKKKNRVFGKQIRYASRKAITYARKRVKGRFVKAGEA